MAGVEVGTAYVTIMPSAKGFASKLQGELGGGMTSAGRRGGQQFTGGMSSSIKAGAGKLFAPIAAGFAALGVGRLFADAVSEASDLNEAGTKTEAIFGKAGKALVDQFAKKGPKALGQSTLEILNAASTFGTFGKAAGLSGKDLSKFSTGFATLSTDLASFYNTSPEEAVEAIGAALRGEAEPIRKYGVLLDDATLRQEALKMGLVKTTKEALTPQQKVLAAQSAIYKQTKDAQGDFAKTSGGLANQQRILQAEFKNIKGEIGKQLLPILTRLAGWFLREGLPAIRDFGGWIKDNLWPALKDGYQTIMPGVQDALKVLGGGVGDNKVSWKQLGDILTQKVIPFLATLVRVWLPVVATNIRVVIEAVKLWWAAFKIGLNIVGSVVSFILRRFDDLTGVWAGVLRALSKVPGFGWAADAANKLDKAGGKARDLARSIDNIKRNITVNVDIYARTRTTGRIELPNGKTVNVGQRAHGGPVRKGQPYVVGERRPELFVPSENGRIEPRLGGAGGKTELSDASLQRLAAILAGTPVQATVSAGSFDRAMGAVR